MANQYINRNGDFRKTVGRICKQCGKGFTVRPCMLKLRTCEFCSPACHYASRGTLEERFRAKVNKANGCWLWTASKDNDGYGHFTMHVGGQKKQRGAHVVSYELNVGPVPDGLCVLHRCDNPPCVRPDHLFLGTHQDNMDDKIRKGRAYAPTGNLTVEQVREIRARHAEGGITYVELGRLYRKDKQQIRRVVLRHNWKHV